MTVSFSDLGLLPALLRALDEEGYTQPTPIQAQAIPHVLGGRDLLGLAQTGTGKTAAFALPILQRLDALGHKPHGVRPIRVLILTPTRELAAQIGDSFSAYGRHLGYRNTVIFGGVGQSAQERELARGIDVLVATPGRLLDLLQQRKLTLQQIDIFVLDEADRMLDMGFIHDVKRVIAQIPKRRQTLFFSATMPDEAQALADVLLVNPETVTVTPVSSTVERIAQSLYFVEKADKRNLLIHLLKSPDLRRVLVFTRTKHGANRVAEGLEKAGVVAAAIHGNKSQNARERALEGFKRGTVRVLVATDIAARGIDVDDVTHVINFELPNVPETYVHRIGRTARAGRDGVALSFCEQEERPYLRDIERLTRQRVPVVSEHGFRSPLPAPGEGGGGGGARRDAQVDWERPAGGGFGRGGRGGGGGGRGGGGRGRDERAHHPQRQPAPGSRPAHPRPPEPRAQADGGGGGDGFQSQHWGGGGGGAPSGDGAAKRRRRRRGRGGGGGGPRPQPGTGGGHGGGGHA